MGNILLIYLDNNVQYNLAQYCGIIKLNILVVAVLVTCSNKETFRVNTSIITIK